MSEPETTSATAAKTPRHDESTRTAAELKGNDRPATHNEAIQTVPAGKCSPESSPRPEVIKKRNAFSELMAPKPAKQSRSTANSQDMSSSAGTDTTLVKTKSRFYERHANLAPTDPRLGLLSYIHHPEAWPSSVVLRVTEHTVLIRDLYPKATVHLLLLPRSPDHYDLHPHDAFSDSPFLSLMRSEAESAARLAAAELSRLLSTFSQSNSALNEALDSADPPSPTSLPSGRDYLADIKVGVHAHPSMSHLHIHLISRDMHSSCMKHRKHYNSFNTPFFIPLSDYPLGQDDERRRTEVQNANLKRGFTCWRCGRSFGNKFAALKEHLEREFDEWKRA